MDVEYKLPLGVCRHAVAALDAALTDFHEIIEDEEISEEDKHQFEYLAEIAGNIMATVVNMTNREMDEADFLAENIGLELENHWEDTDLLDEEI